MLRPDIDRAKHAVLGWWKRRLGAGQEHGRRAERHVEVTPKVRERQLERLRDASRAADGGTEDGTTHH